MSARYLLDSNILIAAIRGEPRPLLNRMASMASERLTLSPLVLAELYTGAEKSRSPSRRRADLADLIEGMEVLPFGAEDASVYGQIRAELESKGQVIGPLDLLIAAQALARDMVLVTGNVREFRRVPGLKCENWLT